MCVFECVYVGGCVCVCDGSPVGSDVWGLEILAKDMNCDLFIVLKLCVEPATLFG